MSCQADEAALDAAASDSEGGISDGVPAQRSGNSLTAGQPPSSNGARIVFDEKLTS